MAECFMWNIFLLVKSFVFFFFTCDEHIIWTLFATLRPFLHHRTVPWLCSFAELTFITEKMNGKNKLGGKYTASIADYPIKVNSWSIDNSKVLKHSEHTQACTKVVRPATNITTIFFSQETPPSFSWFLRHPVCTILWNKVLVKSFVFFFFTCDEHIIWTLFATPWDNTKGLYIAQHDEGLYPEDEKMNGKNKLGGKYTASIADYPIKVNSWSSPISCFHVTSSSLSLTFCNVSAA